MGRCVSKRGLALEGEASVAALEAARRWAPDDDTVAAVAAAAADRLYAVGVAARDAHDWQLAYASFRDTLRIDPTRAWARRYAEEARDQRLG